MFTSSIAVSLLVRRFSSVRVSVTCVAGGPAGLALAVVFVGAAFVAADVDAQFLSGAEDVFVHLAHLDLGTVVGEHLDVEAQRLHLLHEHLEALGDARLGDVLALHDRLVDLDSAEDVVGLDGQQLLQAVRRSVGLECPHLHLTEALATELCLATQRLLGDHAVRAGGAGVDLVVDQVGQLQDVHVADGDRVVVELAGATVAQDGLAVGLDQPLAVHRFGVEVLEDRLDGRVLAGSLFLVPVRAVEHRGGDERAGLGVGAGLRLGAADRRIADLLAALGVGPAPTGCVAEVRFEHLTDVHPARHAERVEDDVDRGPVVQIGHVLDRKDLGDDALVAVAAGQLVADRDLALLGHIDADQLVDPGRELMTVFTGEHLDVDDLAALAVRNLQRGVADFTGLLTEDRPQQALLRRQLGFTLRRDLADQHIARADFGAHADDAAVVEIAKDVVAEVGDVSGDLLRAELGVAGIHLVLVDVDRGQHVVFDQTLAEDDRVLEVVTLPRHQGDEQVLAERELAMIGRRAVGDDRALHDLVAFLDQRAVVDARVLVAAAELAQRVHPLAAGLAFADRLVHDRDRRSADLDDLTVAGGLDEVGGVASDPVLDPGTDVRRLGADQRDRLLLHVGAHEGAVGVVVLEERDQRRADRDDLLRADVHQLHFVGGHRGDVGRGAEEALGLEHLAKIFEAGGLRAATHEDALVLERAVGVDRRVRLGDDVVLFFVGGHVADLTGHLAVLDDPVRRLDEAVGVDPGEGAEGADQADVRAFRCLDRAHAAVVAEVHVADFESGALTAEAARTECRQTAPVGHARQWVDLVHELRQLRGAEELLDRSDDGTNVDERGRGDCLDVLRCHALPNDALHAAEADAHLVLDELADAADAAVGEVVLVVEAVTGFLLDEVQHVADRGDDLVGAQDVRVVGVAVHAPLGRVVALAAEVGAELAGALAEQFVELGDFAAELAVELVAADAAEVVSTVFEECVAEVGACRLDRRGLAGTGPLVDLDECLVLSRSDVLFLLPLTFEEIELGNEALEEPRSMLFVVPAGTQQREDAHAALAGDACAGGDVLAGLVLDVELQPFTTVRMNCPLDELVLAEVAQPEALARLEDHTGAAHELRHDHPLGAVDDEGALLGHHREVAHEHGLLFDLAGVAIHEPGAHEDRRAVGHVLLFALVDRELRRWPKVFVVGIELQLQLQGFAEVLDRRDVAEGFGKALVEEPFEALPLHGDQVGQLQRLGEVGERIALAGRGT